MQAQVEALRRVLEECPTLVQEVNLAGNGLRSLEGLSQVLEHVQVLDISSNELSSLQGLEGLAQLTSLNVSNNNLEDVGYECTNLQSLTHLDLRDNCLRAGGWINVLGSLPALRHLCLDGNPVCHVPAYPHIITTFIPQLKTLDSAPIASLSAHIEGPEQPQTDLSAGGSVAEPCPGADSRPASYSGSVTDVSRALPGGVQDTVAASSGSQHDSAVPPLPASAPAAASDASGAAGLETLFETGRLPHRFSAASSDVLLGPVPSERRDTYAAGTTAPVSTSETPRPSFPGTATSAPRKSQTPSTGSSPAKALASVPPLSLPLPHHAAAPAAAPLSASRMPRAASHPALNTTPTQTVLQDTHPYDAILRVSDLIDHTSATGVLVNEYSVLPLPRATTDYLGSASTMTTLGDTEGGMGENVGEGVGGMDMGMVGGGGGGDRQSLVSVVVESMAWRAWRRDLSNAGTQTEGWSHGGVAAHGDDTERLQADLDAALETASKARREAALLQSQLASVRRTAAEEAQIAGEKLLSLQEQLATVVSERDQVLAQLNIWQKRLDELSADVTTPTHSAGGGVGVSLDPADAPAARAASAGASSGATAIASEASAPLLQTTTSAAPADAGVAAEGACVDEPPLSASPPLRPRSNLGDETQALRARCQSLERIVAIQRQELNRAATGVSDSERRPDPSLVIRELECALEEETQRSERATRQVEDMQATLMRQKEAWRGMEQEFEAAQSLLQVLEERSLKQRSELAQAQQAAKRDREQARAMASLAKQYEDAMQLLQAQVLAFQADCEQRMRQVDTAADKLAALAARVEFARSRMVFAMRVQREKQQPTLIAVTRSPCGRYSSAPTILGQQQLTWHSGDGTSETYQTQDSANHPVAISVLQSEIERLVADRDKLLAQLSTAHQKTEERFEAVVAAVRAEEAGLRQRMVNLAVQEQTAVVQAQADQVKREAQQAVQAAQQAVAAETAQCAQLAAMVEQRVTLAVSGAMAKLQEMHHKVQQVEGRMLSYSQRVHELKTALAARDRRCEELIGELEIVIHRGEEEACKARQTLAAQEQEWMQRVTDWQRRAAEAEHQGSKSVVLARQLERQVTRLRQQRQQEDAAAVAELQRQIDARDEALRAVRRERNALLAVLRQHGIATAIASKPVVGIRADVGDVAGADDATVAKPPTPTEPRRGTSGFVKQTSRVRPDVNVSPDQKPAVTAVADVSPPGVEDVLGRAAGAAAAAARAGALPYKPRGAAQPLHGSRMQTPVGSTQATPRARYACPTSPDSGSSDE